MRVHLCFAGMLRVLISIIFCILNTNLDLLLPWFCCWAVNNSEYHGEKNYANVVHMLFNEDRSYEDVSNQYYVHTKWKT